MLIFYFWYYVDFLSERLFLPKFFRFVPLGTEIFHITCSSHVPCKYFNRKPH